MDDKRRIAIVNKEKCKPKKCGLQCKKACPINKSDKLCIQVSSSSPMAEISEILCVGCNLCVKKCPYQAIKIINLPKDLNSQVTHRYGKNAFKLHRLPTPRQGQVLGLVGTNGIGKSTALRILSGDLKPNLGILDKDVEWKDVIKSKLFKGGELMNYFNNLLENNLKTQIKPQYVDSIPKSLPKASKELSLGTIIEGRIKKVLKEIANAEAGDDEASTKNRERKLQEYKEYVDVLYEELELSHLKERVIGKEQLSGGELQRFAIMITSISNKNILMYDEPSSYLDIKQRLRAARVIRENIAKNPENYVICVEHDLAVLDYLSDFVCCLYGQQTAYGIVTTPYSVREGINVFLLGKIPTENMRFRDYELSFKVSTDTDKDKVQEKFSSYTYPKMVKKLGSFELTVHEGHFNEAQIVVLLGQNGTGKTTFIKMLAGKDKEFKDKVPELSVSYKPQTINPKWEGSVRELLQTRIKDAYLHPQFQTDVAKPMMLEEIIENQVKALSGGELQRVALCLALAMPANVYLIDEPSAYLDSEQRIIAARVIKRFIINAKRCGFIVEHDFIMSTYLADFVIVYEGQPGQKCTANTPQDLVSGMNKFLSILAVTFRRDPTNFRPRINKANSEKDRDQKSHGNYFCLEE
ncbi:P-loop containing nucleoside triphosphate hydrolase [Pseudocohnilembus persalinus]|uniref:p-loop containing nucleoside triphosphate hydrolase n=1 Tax=Pseudocohnilembus persalinus TaxID=266149 RepID=A0A0V0QD74_PSEPJ|nr:P-loop containing nucleoside triphosphate hydrolase [Pseudocohnilembus persalinus]|eukprot:KRX00134.1 P-loop containing nucleoside triphosphate hydrolase [Pseudocohnilembus persalinus]